MNAQERLAPGQPGIEPRWTSSAKSGVGTAASAASRVWFTLSHGIVNEVYFPRVDIANVRDMGFLVADGESYFSEEKRDCRSDLELLGPGVPGFRIVNTSTDGRYVIEKTVITHPHLDVLLQRVRFSPKDPGLHLYALLAPHVSNRGMGNEGWVGDYKGKEALFARRNAIALAMACSAPFRHKSVGFVGVSDGWQDISSHHQMTWEYDRAPGGNIALTAEIDLASCAGDFVLAIGFGGNPQEAGQVARLALEQDFDYLVSHFVSEWHQSGDDDLASDRRAPLDGALVPISVAVLRAHESKRARGGFAASLSIPWGASKSDDDLGGYHLVWPRDLVETATGLLSSGNTAPARRGFQYLAATQDADGRWAQNMWLDGTPYWQGIQMDEMAFPILLADLLLREKALATVDPWPTVLRAASYIVCNGPATQQDRWEEDPGFSPFTLAVEIAALVTAADFAERAGASGEATYLRETADAWNASIDRWTFATGTDLAAKLGIDGYYVRIAPAITDPGSSVARAIIQLKNRPAGSSDEPAGALVSPDALALVRFGLRAPDDPRILGTVRAIDAVLRIETKTGPAWHRYPDDGYGEHEDGSGFDGTGIGRVWPLFAGERAHYELAAGNLDGARALLATMERQASSGGLLPEQVWDADDIPERELFNGRPAGSAMPLAWAHAEYLKLVRSLHDGRVFDTPPQAIQRYLVDRVGSNLVSWRFNNKLRSMLAGAKFRIELPAPATVLWTVDGWKSEQTLDTRDTGLGMHIADLPLPALVAGTTVEFTFHWHGTNSWEGRNYSVRIEATG